MFAYIKGKLTEKNVSNVVIDVNGVGYLLQVSLNTYTRIEKLDFVKLFTVLIVKEDSHTLFGFAENNEKELFLKLLSISGIGPNTARMMLSSLNPDEIINAILQENDNLIKSIKGIGPKTAKRVILELKDKVEKLSDVEALNSSTLSNSNKNQALQALLSLGFSNQAANKAINTVYKEQPDIETIEEILKSALKKL